MMKILEKPIIEWANIPGGTFIMGSPKNEEGRNDNEDQFQVTLSSFQISKHTVTVEQFKMFIEATGYITDAEKGIGWIGSDIYINEEIGLEVAEGINWRHDEKGIVRQSQDQNCPVIHVSWNDAKKFAEWMGCRLPTEAEWEYVCRAGTTTPFYTGENLTSEQANYNGNEPYTHYGKGKNLEKIMPVGSYPPNSWGVFDMHGNVWEWCNDFFKNYPKVAQTNPQGPTYGEFRNLRGGAFVFPAFFVRSAVRFAHDPIDRGCTIGFRLAKSL